MLGIPSRDRLFLCAFITLVLVFSSRVSPPLHALAAATFPGSEAKQALADEKVDPAGQEVGGQQVIELKRRGNPNSSMPEFTSVSNLPGRGMNLIQITANLPGKGEVQVLASPSLEEADRQLNGGPDDVHGVKSFASGGAFLVPYPNRIRGKLSSDGKNFTTQWNGKTLTLPAV
jgi:hypothetical protein